MELKDTKVNRPDRQPDFVTRVGHAFWWEEMIFMHVFKGFMRIYSDQETGVLYCIAEGKKISLGSAQSVYDKWWYQVFESKLLGEDGDE